MKTVELETNAPVVSAPAGRINPRSAQMNAGAQVTPHQLRTVTGQMVGVPDPGCYVHLQFRRFAGCPVCDLHLRSFMRRHDEIIQAGIREIVLFHSTAEDLRTYASEFPFALVADPHKQLYTEFGVQASVRSLLDPRAWIPILRGVLGSLWQILVTGRKMPPVNPAGGRFGLPADLLIAPDGTVIASKYGVHVYDQWSVDELLSLTAPSQAAPAKKPTVVKSPEELNRKLREGILRLPGVTEHQNAGIHEDAFFVGRTMFMHIHGHGHCDIRLSVPDQQRVLAEDKARKHRWAPQKGYVTFVVQEQKDLEPAMNLIHLSHQHFADAQAL